MIGSWKATTDKSGDLNAARKKIIGRVKGKTSLHAEDITVWHFTPLDKKKATLRVAIGFLAKIEYGKVVGKYYVYKTVPGVDLGICEETDRCNGRPITGYSTAKKVAQNMMLRG